MKTIEIKLYKFEELSKDSQQKAIEKLSDINVSYNWWESTYEDAERIGLKITSFNLDRNKHAKGTFNLSVNEVAQSIFNEHGETCGTYKTAKNFMKIWEPVFNDYMDSESENYESSESEDQLQDIENVFLNDILEDYATMLQNESEYLQSEQSIIDTITANDYDFTEDGKLH